MPDYQEMYLKLMRASEQALRLIISAQQECEDMYLSEFDIATDSDGARES